MKYNTLTRKLFSRPFSTGPSGIGSPLPSHVNVCIIGGGIMGSSAAYWLRQQKRSVLVIEKDPTYSICSTARAAGGFRQQFSISESVEMSMFGHSMVTNPGKYFQVPALGEPPVGISFDPTGYLFLASGQETAERMLTDWKMQKSLGANVELLSPTQLKSLYPSMNFNDVVLGTHGNPSCEGMIDPWNFLHVVKNKNISMGAQYFKGDVDKINVSGDTITGVSIKTDIESDVCIEADYVINAGGPWSGLVNDLLPTQFVVPVTPRKRYVYLIHVPKGPGRSFPMLIDSTGMWCRFERDKNEFLCGMSQNKDEDESSDHSNLDVDCDFFDSHIWPALASRAKAFEELKVVSCFSGYYDYNTVDQNALIGFHPNYSNHLLICGFSGHGLQHALAAGRGIAELLMHGEYKTLDLNIFSPRRFLEGQSLYEKGII